MNKVILQFENTGFKWIRNSRFFVKGYIFDLNERLYMGEGLLEYFHGIESYTDFYERVSYANGCFSVIYLDEDIMYAASDVIRSLPLFYIRLRGDWIISDSAYQLLENFKKPEFNESAAMEFLATGYVTGNETLVHGIRQVQAGEIIQFNGEELKQKFYFSYRTSVTLDKEYEDLKKQGSEIFEGVFQRFIASLNGRMLVLPLSGGFDSRLIAVMLKKYEYKNVLCMTYGRKGNPELKYSRAVAEKLGFKWIFVEYTEELIRNYLKDETFKSYFPYGGNLTSMFFMQEYFAVKYLKDKEMIPPDSIFAPGHSGDFLGGSQLSKHGNLSLTENLRDIANRLYFVKYNYLKPSPIDKDKLLNRLEKTIEEKFTGEADLAYSIHEDWDFKEKLAKFNVNSVTIYEYFGYEFRLPYWDRELIRFFRNLPLHVKINMYLYDDILCSDFFEPYDLNFDEELHVNEAVYKRQLKKNKIKSMLPAFLLRMFIHKKDNLFYREITREMITDLQQKGKRIKTQGNAYNSLIVQWYVEDTRKRIAELTNITKS